MAHTPAQRKLQKVQAGEYKSDLGTVRYAKSASGAAHTRYAHMVWLITWANGKCEWTKTLSDAEYLFSRRAAKAGGAA